MSVHVCDMSGGTYVHMSLVYVCMSLHRTYGILELAVVGWVIGDHSPMLPGVPEGTMAKEEPW